MKTSDRRPTPALVVALIALVAALAGTATALPGRNSVDKNDIKRSAVKSKHIKNGQVKKKDLHANSVDGTKIVDGTVAAADLADSEPVHVVGAPGEPKFADGGEGDCFWRDVSASASIAGSPTFHMDQNGYVHLGGIAVREDGPGGDGACDDEEDSFVYTLPAGYAPERPVIAGTGEAIALVVPVGGIDMGGGVIVPAGTVAQASSATDTVAMDAVIFRAASPAAAKAAAKRGPIKVGSLNGAAKLVR